MNKFKAVWLLIEPNKEKGITKELFSKLPRNSKLYEQKAMDIDYKGKIHNYYAKAYSILSDTNIDLAYIVNAIDGVNGFACYDESLQVINGVEKSYITNKILRIGNHSKELKDINNDWSSSEMCNYLIRNINECLTVLKGV